jgi:hypothetical protein
MARLTDFHRQHQANSQISSGTKILNATANCLTNLTNSYAILIRPDPNSQFPNYTAMKQTMSVTGSQLTYVQCLALDAILPVECHRLDQ